MSFYSTRQIDSENFTRCEICLEYLPIHHHSEGGDTLICKGCDTEYRLESIHPARISILRHSYQDSYIHDATPWE